MCKYSSNEITELLQKCLNIGSFADLIDDEVYVLDMDYETKKKIWRQEDIEKNAHNQYNSVISQIMRSPVAIELAQQRLEEYLSERDAWVNAQPDYKRITEDEWDMCTESVWTDLYDAHMKRVEHRWWYGRKEMCRFFQLPIGCRAGDKCEYSHDTDTCSVVSEEIHLDENGEPEICRYFNTPGGCTREAEGKGACPYKHIDGISPEPELCRYFNLPGGCRKGAECIFKHEIVIPPIENDWRLIEKKPISSDEWIQAGNRKPPKRPNNQGHFASKSCCGIAFNGRHK
jgi:hypothetical protein